jgi:hypothetical protein
LRPIRRFARFIPAYVAGSACLFPLLGADVLAQSARQPVREGRSALEPAGRTAWLERVEQARRRYEAFAADARLSLHLKVPEPGTAPQPTGFLDDPTLRRGDVVVAPEGLMVFRGARRFPYTYADFDAVRTPAAARANHAPELIELQRAHERWKP